MSYQQMIAAIAPDANARHVEAFMRSEHGTLDALSPEQFRAEVFAADLCAQEEPAVAESLARSYGL